MTQEEMDHAFLKAIPLCDQLVVMDVITEYGARGTCAIIRALDPKIAPMFVTLLGGKI